MTTMTLEMEQQVQGQTTQQGQRLALLQVLAMMVESLHHTVLLRKYTQVRKIKRHAVAKFGVSSHMKD